MFMVKGFLFVEKDGITQRLPLPDGLLAQNFDEAHEAFSAMGITHYLFRLVPVVLKEEE